MKAYVDDAYLWCRLIHASILDQAIQITKLWDTLSGQKLNDSKSVIWSTTTAGRKVVQQTFPEMQMTLSFEALGVRVYTSQRDDCNFPEATLAKVCHTIECIGALPLSMPVKSFLIGAKAIPTITYGAHVSRIPKVSMRKTQSAVLKALWQGRPMARSKWLVQLFHSRPHRTDPVLAQAYCSILDLFRFCHQSPLAVQQLIALWPSRQSQKHSVLARFASACQTMGLSMTSHPGIRYHDSAALILGHATAHDVAHTLQQVARQKAYEWATKATRKDLIGFGGLLDFHASTLFLRKPTFQTPSGPSAMAHCESMMVGCTITKDRLFAAGWSQNDNCRFCGQSKESLEHLVFFCDAYHSLTRKPVLHELGNNFPMLGLVEHPFRLTQFRLQQAIAKPGDARAFDPSSEPTEAWTDGSVMWSTSFWLTTAAFAVVNKAGTVTFTGRVQRWGLSSYVAELWAVWIAFSQASAAIQIFCDNRSVVRNVNFLITTGHVKQHWKCLDWWHAIQTVLSQRQHDCSNPLTVSWIPAHVCEDTPDELLDPVVVAGFNTTVEHVRLNRRADRAAKSCALRISPVKPDMIPVVQAASTLYQEWLVKLHCHLDTHAVHEEEPERSSTNDILDLPTAKRMFPNWLWDEPKRAFPWKPKIALDLKVPDRWRHAKADWHTICCFARQLQWRHEEGCATAFCELAALFHFQGHRLQGDYSVLTMHSVTCVF